MSGASAAFYRAIKQFSVVATLAVTALAGQVASASTIGIWTDPTRPYQAGWVNNQPLFVSQQWGLLVRPQSGQDRLGSATFGLQFRPRVYQDGDGSSTLQLRVVEWSPEMTAPIGGVLFESQPIDATDLLGQADQWGSRRASIPLDLAVSHGSAYLVQFIGTGFVLFEQGAGWPLHLNQDHGGWGAFGGGLFNEFTFASTVPEPSTLLLLLASLGVMLRSRAEPPGSR
jgi:hypothetical protein